MANNSNKNSLKESKVIRAEDLLYIIKSNSGYKDNSGNQMIPVSLLVDYLNTSGDGLWTIGYDENITNTSFHNTVQDQYFLLWIAEGLKTNYISMDNAIDNGITIHCIGSNNNGVLILNDGITNLQHSLNVKLSTTVNNLTLLDNNGTSNYVLDNVPNYANDAAADGDGDLLSGAIYTTTAGGRTIFIKP